MQSTHSFRSRLLSSGAGFFLLAGLVSMSQPAGATSLILEGTANLLDRSDTVVTGTVVSIEPRMHEVHQFIYTYVTVEVTEVLKGSRTAPGQLIVLEELGGRIDRIIHHVDAVPEFEIGEEVLTFLENRPEGIFRTYGMIQGKFRFETDRSGRRILTRPAEWTDTYLAHDGKAYDLTAVRADGSFLADPLLDAIRARVNNR